MNGHKTTTRAFRIDDQVDRHLRESAEREGLTVSFLANKALRRLVEWDMYADRFGFMAVPNQALARLIDCLPEEKVREVGRWTGENVYRAFTTFRFATFNIETALEVLPKLTSKYMKAFEYEERRDGRQVTIVMNYDRGQKYSVYFEEIARALFGDLAGRTIRTEAFENALVVRFAHSVPQLADPAATFGRREAGFSSGAVQGMSKPENA